MFFEQIKRLPMVTTYNKKTFKRKKAPPSCDDMREGQSVKAEVKPPRGRKKKRPDSHIAVQEPGRAFEGQGVCPIRR